MHDLGRERGAGGSAISCFAVRMTFFFHFLGFEDFEVDFTGLKRDV